MGFYIPLVRASALVPMLRWMLVNDRDTDAALTSVDLGWYPWDDPVQPIPVRNAVEFLRNFARAEGPDIPVRVVGDTGLFELAMLARVALGTRTPRAALDRIADAMPYHSTHEVLSISRNNDGCIIRNHWSTPLDAEAQHLVDQYLLAMLGVLCRLTHAGERIVTRVSMAPHPDYGFDHLVPLISGTEFIESSGSFELFIPETISECQFKKVARDRMMGASAADWEPLRGDGTLSGSVGKLLSNMIRDGASGIDRLSAQAGISRRTFQRQLARENVVYSELVEAARRDALEQLLADQTLSLREVSDRLGFACQSTLTRACHRWTGAPPSRLRRARAVPPL